MLKSIFGIILFCGIFAYISNVSINSNSRKFRTVFVVLLARNKQHTLPYFLSLFSNLHYPKNRISLFIRSDHNIDKTSEIINEWLKLNRKYYHSTEVIFKDDSNSGYYEEGNPSNWTSARFNHIINLKEEALQRARKMWADYIWFLDVDVFILESNLLMNLIGKSKPIVAPLLKSLGTYSNYWCGMSQSYWYTRTEDYIPILERKKKGCFAVPMVHSCVLIDLSYSASDFLSHDSNNIPGYTGPKDDIIAFAVGAKQIGLEMFICNDENYGYIPPPLHANDNISKDYQHLVDIKLEALVDFAPLTVSPALENYVIPQPEKSKLGFDNIYLINLRRRLDRRERMLRSFDELGFEAEIFNAIDGKEINAKYLEDIGVKQLHNYKDPWSKRDMTYGEIGCFLSHYYIWKDTVKNGYEKVIVFEDDIRFEPYFKDKLFYMMKHISYLRLNWDLIYLGRKILSNETWVAGTNNLVHVGYSHWTLCYILTLEGAKKLLWPKPLGKMIPVDEYLPIMFDRHPEDAWKIEFEPRNLKAYSVYPLMVFPTHYTGQEGYISDTEESPIIEDDLLPKFHKVNFPLGPPSLPSRFGSDSLEGYKIEL